MKARKSIKDTKKPPRLPKWLRNLFELMHGLASTFAVIGVLIGLAAFIWQSSAWQHDQSDNTKSEIAFEAESVDSGISGNGR